MLKLKECKKILEMVHIANQNLTNEYRWYFDINRYNVYLARQTADNLISAETETGEEKKFKYMCKLLEIDVEDVIKEGVQAC